MVSKRHLGFTLIELMIAVAILALLVSVAYPSYHNHICKVERNQAKGDLLAFAQGMESFYTTNQFSYKIDNVYIESIFPPYSPADRSAAKKKYTLSAQVAAPGDAYVLTAERAGGSCNDGVLTLASNGVRQWVKDGVTLTDWEN